MTEDREIERVEEIRMTALDPRQKAVLRIRAMLAGLVHRTGCGPVPVRRDCFAGQALSPLGISHGESRNPHRVRPAGQKGNGRAL